MPWARGSLVDMVDMVDVVDATPVRARVICPFSQLA